MNRRLMASAACLIAAGFMLSGCGRAGKPDFPDETTYPQSYPKPVAKAGAVQTPTTPGQNRIFVDPSVKAVYIASPGMANVGTSTSPLDNDRESTEQYSPLPALQPPTPMQIQ